MLININVKKKSLINILLLFIFKLACQQLVNNLNIIVIIQYLKFKYLYLNKKDTVAAIFLDFESKIQGYFIIRY